MRKITLIFIVLLLLLANSAFARPKIALVLSGGVAARGLAEIGVIKALEEENIPIDYIAGTSMGAVIASLFAQGYNSEEITDIVRSIDWINAFVQKNEYQELRFSDKENYGKYFLNLELDRFKPVFPQSMVNSQKPAVIFTRISVKALEQSDFDRLKIPFRANATDLESGKEKVFSGGYLPDVLRATSAVPLMFPPVEIDGRLYIDGGAVNNLPVNLAREFKPDLIIAVNLGSDLKKKEELTSMLSVINQNLAFLQKEAVEKHRKEADLLIEPDISGYSFYDFDKIDRIIETGHRFARAQIPGLKLILQKKGYKPETRSKAAEPDQTKIYSASIEGQSVFSESALLELLTAEVGRGFNRLRAEEIRKKLEEKYYSAGYLLARVSFDFNANRGKLTYRVDEGAVNKTEFSGQRYTGEFFLRGKVKKIAIFNYKTVEDNIDRLYSTGKFTSVNYTLQSEKDGFVLRYILREKSYNNLALGLRYDSYLNLALLSDLTFNYSNDQNFRQTVSLKVGNEFDYELITEFLPNQFGQDFISGFDIFYQNQLQDVYLGKSISSTYGMLSAGANLRLTANINPIGQVTGGIEAFKVSYSKITPSLPDENISKLYLRTRFESLDNPILPRRGLLAGIEYQDGLNIGNYCFNKLMLDLAGYVPLDAYKTIFATGKICLGQGNMPLSEYYRLGGEASLIGYGRNQFLNRNLFQTRLGFRFPVYTSGNPLFEGVFLSLFQDYGAAQAEFSKLFCGDIKSGTGLEFQFNTLFGLSARASFGYGQDFAAFLAVGNNF